MTGVQTCALPISTGEVIQDKLINFSNTMLTDLKNTGKLIENNLKEQLGPLSDGLKTMFSSFMNNLLQEQQQQESSLLNYLPFGIAGIGLLFILNKK